MAPHRKTSNSDPDKDEQNEVQIDMAQVLYAVVVGLVLASLAGLIGLPDWAAPLSYVGGMISSLLVRDPTAGPRSQGRR